MNPAVLWLAFLDMAFVGLLPFVFFRRDGSFNLRWFMTALPFMVCLVVLALGMFGVLRPWPVFDRAVLYVGEFGAVFACATSIALIAFTIGSHRVPLALWHQQNDAPLHIVTWGAYKRIRHPFYAAFLVGLVGVVLAFPHWITSAAFVYALIVLNVTAAREENRLAASEFAAEYQAYMRRTGRFLPRLQP